MTPDMITALSQSRAMATGFFEFDFSTGTRRLMIGAGEVDSAGVTFKGYDETFGSVAGGQEVSEDASGEAPNTSVTIAISPDADKADVASEAVQLTPVRISLAALTLDASKHLIAIPDPEPLFDGFVDQAISQLDNKKDEVEYTLVSVFDFFFEDNEGQRLNGPFHKSMYPAETGLDNVTGVTRRIYWGTEGPNGGGGSFGGGGGSAGRGGDPFGYIGGSLVAV